MPKAWSEKDERKYEEIRRERVRRGVKVDRAAEIAARVVNRDRRQEGRTQSGRKATSGTGNPTLSLEKRTRQELYNRARQLDVAGRSRMSKAELVRAIRRRS